jgi:zinc protease
MQNQSTTLLLLAMAIGILASPVSGQEIQAETFTLPNGLTVILHEDHRLPQVTINTWFSVGSKDEAPGRTGFAHLFEHLMFMGTTRVPGNQFDLIMEGGGGANNASTSEDRTNYFSWGPSSQLPTLMWLDADRLEGLGRAMTQEKLDKQRSIVRNERRQSYENRPYGKAGLILPEALYPAGHPYQHPVIGSHEDLEAATLADVKDFFATYYVPGNASLVVAGDFDREQVKKIIADTFGAVAAQPLPQHLTAETVTLEREVRRMATDKVRFPRLYLVWHSPRAYDAGDAELNLVAPILSDGSSGRLFKRLVLDEQLAQDVVVYQSSQELISEFHIEATAAAGSDLERIKCVILEELERFKKDGPTAAELARVKAATEADFLRGVENLAERADLLNAYYKAYGAAASFQRDLKRRLAPGVKELQDAALATFTDGRVDLRILPEGSASNNANLDKRPADLQPRQAELPRPIDLKLVNGVPLHVVNRPGSGLFTGYLLASGGDCNVGANKAGLAFLSATLLSKGAGTRNAAAFAEAVSTLGAGIDARADWHSLTIEVSGLTSRLGATLDLWADAILRARLTPEDFSREKDLQLAAIKARVESPARVADLTGRALLFGRDDPRGRPVSGWAGTVQSLALADVKELLPRLLDPVNVQLVFVGDLDPAVLKRELDRRLASWQTRGENAAALPQPVVALTAGRIVLVDRPGAPQSVLYLARPVSASGERLEAVRDSINTLFGGSFTSRLNQNIREKNGFSYGASSRIWQEGNQFLLRAGSSVQTAVTGAALTEFKKEFDLLASGNVSPEEMEKARRTVRFSLVSSTETTASLAEVLAEFAANGQPLDGMARELGALDAVTAEAINAEARSGLFDWSQLLIVIVGDKAAVLPQLKQAGFPDPVTADTEGRLQ